MKLYELLEYYTGILWVCDHSDKSINEYYLNDIPDRVLKKRVNTIGVVNYCLFVEVENDE